MSLAALSGISVRRVPAERLGPGAERARERAARAGDWFHYELLADGSSYLLWTGLFEFLVSGDGREILCARLRGSEESFENYLLNQVLSFALVRRGIEPLHATVLAAGDRALALMGGSGCGKSTLAAALLRRGLRLMTDDMMLIRKRGRRVLVEPGAARIKLFPAVARKLLPDRGDWPAPVPMIRGTAKMILRIPPRLWSPRALPLARIYILPSPRTRAKRIEIRAAGRKRAFFKTIENTFNPVVFDRDRMRRQFEFAEALSSDVPYRDIRHPRELRLLPDLCEAILKDLGAGGDDGPGRSPA